MSLVWSPDYAPVDGDFADVSLLLKGEGTNGSTTILDSSSNNLSVTVNGDAQISTAVNTPFGTGDGVLAFDGTGDYLTAASSADFAFGTGDFTVEFWAHFQLSANYQIFVATKPIGSFADGWSVFVSPSGAIGIYSNGFIVQSGSLSSNTFYHIAVTRASGLIRAFADGSQVGTTVNNTQNFTRNTLAIGSNVGGTETLQGYISNLRITKGVARYTSNFTPPTAPFPILSPSTRIEVGDGFDVDAANYILAVEAADTAALEPAVRTAINDFVVGCKSDGIWNAIKASCILAGARTLDGALVPLKGGAPSKFGTAANWNYNRNTGLQGDGSTNYLDSNRNNDADLKDNCHLAIWKSDTTSGPNPYFIGCGTSGFAITKAIGQEGMYSNSGTPFALPPNNSSATGLHGHSRSLSSSVNYKRPGSSISTVSNTTAVTQPTNSNYVFAVSNAGTPTAYTASRLAFYSIGSNLDLALLDARVSTLISDLGAAIP